MLHAIKSPFLYIVILVVLVYSLWDVFFDEDIIAAVLVSLWAGYAYCILPIQQKLFRAATAIVLGVLLFDIVSYYIVPLMWRIAWVVVGW